MKTTYACFILFLLFSCARSKHEEVVYYLTDGSEKYWTLMMEYPIKRYTGATYNLNGVYSEFIISDLGKRTKRNLHFAQVWNLINDSTLAIGNVDTNTIMD